MKNFLTPLGHLYLSFQNLQRRRHKTGRASLGVPVISVGNIVHGGTGKTPFTYLLARSLAMAGFHPAILTRGYGSKGLRPCQASGHGSVESFGDEAVLLARLLPGIPVVVDSHRYRGGLWCQQHYPKTNIYILDDGFQHFSLERNLDIVLLRSDRPQDLLAPPVGRLRENITALEAADFVIETGVQDPSMRGLGGKIPKHACALQWKWQGWSGWPKERPPAKAWVATGIAHGDLFLRQVKDAGWKVVGSTLARDHFHWSPSSQQNVIQQALEKGAKTILMTSKDRVKWPSSIESISLVTPLRRPQWLGLEGLTSVLLRKVTIGNDKREKALLDALQSGLRSPAVLV